MANTTRYILYISYTWYRSFSFFLFWTFHFHTCRWSFRPWSFWSPSLSSSFLYSFFSRLFLFFSFHSLSPSLLQTLACPVLCSTFCVHCVCFFVCTLLSLARTLCVYVNQFFPFFSAPHTSFKKYFAWINVHFHIKSKAIYITRNHSKIRLKRKKKRILNDPCWVLSLIFLFFFVCALSSFSFCFSFY